MVLIGGDTELCGTEVPGGRVTGECCISGTRLKDEVTVRELGRDVRLLSIGPAVGSAGDEALRKLAVGRRGAGVVEVKGKVTGRGCRKFSVIGDNPWGLVGLGETTGPKGLGWMGRKIAEERRELS